MTDAEPGLYGTPGRVEDEVATVRAIYDAFARRDVDALATYRDRAPGVRQALPTHEHFVPVLVAAGASVDRSERVQFPITGFAYGSFTRRSVQFG